MEQWRRREVVVVIAGWLPLGLWGQPQPLHFATDANDQSGLAPGGRAVLGRAFQRLGMAVSFEALPLRRALRMTELGRLDGETLRVRTVVQEHPTLLLVPVAIATVKVIGYVRQRNPVPIDWRMLPQLRAGYPRGIVLIENLLAGVPRKFEATTHADLLRLLRTDAIDIALLTQAAGEPETDVEQLADLAALPAPLSVTPLYPLLHERHRDLLPRLTAVLRRWRTAASQRAFRSAAWGVVSP